MNDLDKNLMKDHNYDGIYELDNDLPFWWVALFIITVIIAVVYCSYYFLGLGVDQEAEYIAAVKKENRIQEEKQILALANSKSEDDSEGEHEVAVNLPEPTEQNIAQGKEIFTKNCFACHGMNGSGLVGPNLTDNFFIHGPRLADMITIITKGNPAKGMIAWSPQLSSEQIYNVASFVHSLKGTNVAGKPPEGKEFK